ncbi:MULTISPECIES: AraC family transcriptional regulator [Streptomyces]|uniref:AraC family transcriptional regulator n=1 Tax=Streptomyces changanensis TaxID=2964669 RepID=A0ABY5N3F8_9ACTN|nr:MULTISPECIES: AraC family transcriptional regulator [Streptomyces]UUS30472.1 AraC family transcriptional regulator [Streptomyces changanensis]
MSAGTIFRTGDVEEARREIGARFYATFMDVIEQRGRRFSACFDTVHLGAMVVGDMRCGADVRLRFGELGAYHVNVPLSGRLEVRQGAGRLVTATPASGTVLDPRGHVVVERWAGDCRVVAVKVETAALRRRLEELLGRTPPRGLVLEPALDLTRGAGRDWATLVRQLAREAADPTGLAQHPLVAAPLQDALLTGLLLAADHPYRDELDEPDRTLRPAPVKRVMDAVRERPEHPFTATELAGLARVSTRRLQESFRAHVGTTPMGYVRDVRLARVRDELRGAEPDGGLTVSEVAWRWGFTHLGRFAARYRERFGEAPSQTLHTPPPGGRR